MSGTAATPVFPDVLSDDDREMFRARLLHASVYHPTEFAGFAALHLATLAMIGSSPVYGEHGAAYCGQHLQKAVEALPVHEGCCVERAEELVSAIGQTVADARR